MSVGPPLIFEPQTNEFYRQALAGLLETEVSHARHVLLLCILYVASLIFRYVKQLQNLSLNVAKDAAISGVGILTAGIGSGITSTGSTIANMAIQTGVGALKGGINAGTGAVVNALNINQSGNLAFDMSDKYWKGAGASMLMGVGSGAVAGLAGSIGMKDANGALMAGFGSKDVKIDGLLNGLLRSGVSVAGKYAVENGVGALAYSWDHQGSIQGYSGTKFEWGNAMSTIAGEGLRSANLFGNGALNELLAYGGMKIGAFVGNSFQHGLAGEDLRTMRGIDLMDGVSASVDAGALVRAFGHDFINGGARDQDPASRFWQQGMESTWMGTTIFGMSADGSGFSGGFGNAHRGELDLAAIGSGIGRAAVDGVEALQRAEWERKERERMAAQRTQGGIPEKPQGAAANAVLERARKLFSSQSMSDMGSQFDELTGGKDPSEWGEDEKAVYQAYIERSQHLQERQGLAQLAALNEQYGVEMSDEQKTKWEGHLGEVQNEYNQRAIGRVQNAFNQLYANSSLTTKDREEVWTNLDDYEKQVLTNAINTIAPNQRDNKTEEWDKKLYWFSQERANEVGGKYAKTVQDEISWGRDLRQRTADRMCNITCLATVLEANGVSSPYSTIDLADYLDMTIQGDSKLSGSGNSKDTAPREEPSTWKALATKFGVNLTLQTTPNFNSASSLRSSFDEYATPGGSFMLGFKGTHMVTYAGHDENGIFINNPLGHYDPAIKNYDQMNTANRNYGFMNFYTWEQARALKIGGSFYQGSRASTGSQAGR